MKLQKDTINKIIDFQKNEITEYFVYKNLANVCKNNKNKKTLNQIADDELRHYNFWKEFTKIDVQPNKRKIFFFYIAAKTLWITFTLKLMENWEQWAQKNYLAISKEVPEAVKIMKEEEMHEQKLIDVLEEDILTYIWSIVLGLNDALVELTWALAWLTFALQNTQLIAMTWLIIWIAASFSMAGSEYLSTKTEWNTSKALKSALYTGLAYVFTVICLITPYLLLNNYITALITTLVIAVIIIACFNYYLAIAKNYSFKQRFLEMFIISMWVAALSFWIWRAVRVIFGIEI